MASNYDIKSESNEKLDELRKLSSKQPPEGFTRILILGVAHRDRDNHGYFCVGGRIIEDNSFGDGVRLVSNAVDNTYWGLGRNTIIIQVGSTHRLVEKLDIVDVPIFGIQNEAINQGWQPENRVVDEYRRWKFVGKLDLNTWTVTYPDEIAGDDLNFDIEAEFKGLIDQPCNLWHIDGDIDTAFVSQDNFPQLNELQSVLMVKPQNLRVAKSDGQFRVTFNYEELRYDLALTDVQMQTVANRLCNREFKKYRFRFGDNCLIRLSLMPPIRPRRHRRYKLVGSVIEFSFEATEDEKKYLKTSELSPNNLAERNNE